MKEILIFSGAGLSAESGLTTFRDTNGLWLEHDPMVVANIRVFDKNKELVRGFYNYLRMKLPEVQPNAAHIGIAQLQQELGTDTVKIFTQNVDDLLERAGAVKVHHVHGFLTEMMCREERCGHHWDIGYTEAAVDITCPKCSSPHIKPGVVFFGEHAPGYQELYSTFKKSREDLIIVIGTSGEVVSLDKIAGNRYSTHKSTTLLNNLEHDPLGFIDYSLFDIKMFKPASEAWPHIKEHINAFLAK